MMPNSRFAIAPPVTPTVGIWGSQQLFPVHRIYCVGRNYADHAREMGFTGREPPFFFMKPADAVLYAPPDTVVDMPYPSMTQHLHYELELVIAIGRSGSHIQIENAHEYIFGYAVGLDMTRRDLQNDMKKQGRPWCIGKGFDYSAPIASILPVAQAADIEKAEITLYMNGQQRQASHIAHMLCNIAETISAISQAWTLQPGDLIYTGTPEGVGAVQVGDVLSGHITGLPPLHLRITSGMLC